MKKETIIWQLIVVALGILLITTLGTYLRDKNEIEAETNRAQCLANNQEKGFNLEATCVDIKAYKLQDSAKGFLK